jgi:HK97 family phage major capsid protein
MNRIERLRSLIASLTEARNAERSELLELSNSTDDLTGDDEARFNELDANFGEDGTWNRDAELTEAQARLNRLEAVQASGERAVNRVPVIGTSDPSDIWGRSMDEPAGNLRMRAERAISAVVNGSDAQDAAVARMRSISHDPTGAMARHILVTGNPDYQRGFVKLMTGQQYGITPDEARAIEQARALSTVVGNGGYAIPFVLDPTVIDTGVHVWNTLRMYSNVISTVGTQWAGVASSGVTAGMVGEATEATDNSPAFTQPAISVRKAHEFVPFSFEIDMDFEGGLQNELRRMFSIAKDDLEEAQFALGAGTGNNVQGIVTGLVAAGGATVVASSVADALTNTGIDFDLMEEALPQKFRSRAMWLGNKAGYNATRRFATTDGQALWYRISDAQPLSLKGYATGEVNSMDGVINAAATNYMFILGSIAETYNIVDRVGISVDVIPHLFGATNRFPTGQKGMYAFWRFGAGVVNATASRILNV